MHPAAHGGEPAGGLAECQAGDQPLRDRLRRGRRSIEAGEGVLGGGERAEQGEDIDASEAVRRGRRRGRVSLSLSQFSRSPERFSELARLTRGTKA
jgi:hypothetical protein